MWPMKRQARHVVRSEIRDRKSIKLNVDRLEERALLSFFPMSYSIFPKATASVAGIEASNGQEYKSFSLPRMMDGFAETRKVHANGTSAFAFAKMEATASSRNNDNIHDGTIKVLNADLDVKVQKSTAARSHAQTNFTYRFNSTSNFTFKESASFLWTWNLQRTAPGALGSIGIYDDRTGARLAGSDLKVTKGTTTTFSAMSMRLPRGEYSIKLICANDTDVMNMSTLRGTVNWSITTA